MRKEEYIQLKSIEPEERVTASCFKRFDTFRVNGEKTKHPQSIDSNKFELVVRPKEIKTVKRHGKLMCGLISLPKSCGKILMTLKLIVFPAIAILWDFVDVLADTYYFYSLETSEMIDKIITRNVQVNNSILTFAILGGLKSVVIAMCYSSVLRENLQEEDQRSYSQLFALVATSFKIVMEDAPELILEYFFVDKFVTDRQPWILVTKDVVTALIYSLSLKNAIQVNITVIVELPHDNFHINSPEIFVEYMCKCLYNLKHCPKSRSK